MGNIRIIGPRSSGKTTYLAALAYLPKASGEKSYFKIEPVGEDAKKLAAEAENIICLSESLTPTGVRTKDIFSLPVYQFTIDVKLPLRQPERIDLVVRDYPGEIFDELEAGNIDEVHQAFMQDCFMSDVEGCLILLSKWEEGSDRFYKRVFNQFLELMDNEGRGSNLRIAIAMSKCERGELWPGRIEPEVDLFGLHLPDTKALLESRIPAKNLAFFAVSTFGVLRRDDPRPNRTDEMGYDGKVSVLRQPKIWQPYGMMAPLYWLNSGKRIKHNV